MPNIAFDPGHGPQSNPSSHRLYPIAHPPLIARLGPCRSMPALGPSGVPVHEGAKIVGALVHEAPARRGAVELLILLLDA
jgi:hypothetical protein